MSKKAPLDMSGLLATKGQGTPANDAPSRPVVPAPSQDQTIGRKDEKTPSSAYVNLGFKVPKEFRHRLRKIAAEEDTSMVDLLREAVELYEQQKKAGKN